MLPARSSQSAFLIPGPVKDFEFQSDNKCGEVPHWFREKECAVKLLVLGLLPIILLSLLMVRQSIICVAIGIPVLILWVLSAVVALIPDGLSSDPEK